MSDPRVLLLDEPTHGVDVGAKSDIYDIIHNLAGDGLSIIVASSELPEIMAIADRCAVFSAGNLVSVLDRAEMSEETILNLAFQCHSSPRSSQ
jgi:ABC-type sugar transport system ATPase subunit